jgi:hypothetical protein
MPENPLDRTAPLPLTHQAHPLWAGFSWATLLKILQVAAAIAPVVVAIADPGAAAEANQLSGLSGQLAGALGNQGTE